MKKLSLISAIIVGSAIALTAQSGYYIDGIKLSENFYSSTARNASMGGASAALGADLGAVAINPAAIGVFKKGEFSFSPIFNAFSSTSNYLGTKTDDSYYKFNLGNIGAAFTFNTNNRSGWMDWSIAIGYSRTNDLSNSFIINGQTNTTNFGNELVSYANGNFPGQLDTYWERLAYDAVVIDTFGVENQYRSLYKNADISQNHVYSIKGSTGEYYFGMGGNYNDQLYVGATLNIKSGNYSEQFDHTESEISNTSDLASYTFTHTIATSSRGFNMKIGAIYKPVDFLRLGLSIHTPTVTNVQQESDSKIYAVSKNGNADHWYPSDSYGNRALPLNDEYTITTPFRAVAGAAVMFQQFGIISFDYEFADYKSITFSDFSNKTDQSNAINGVKNSLRSTHNIRIGAEAKLESFYLRGGYAYYMSPYNTNMDNKDANSMIYSGGLGYRVDGFYIDFGYSLLTRSEKYYMYDQNRDPSLSSANLDLKNGSFITTMGFKF